MSIQPYLDTYLTRHGGSLDTSSDRELMYALTAAVRDLQKPMGHAQGKRKLYYFSAEFLVGRLLRANHQPGPTRGCGGSTGRSRPLLGPD